MRFPEMNNGAGRQPILSLQSFIEKSQRNPIWITIDRQYVRVLEAKYLMK